MSGDESAQVIDLRSRSGFRPDIAGLARGQLTSMREAKGMSFADFAEALTPLLGWPVTPEVLESWETTATPPGDVLVAAGLIAKTGPTDVADSRATDLISSVIGDRFADVTAVFPTRSEFTTSLPPHTLFDEAQNIRAVGLSLNVICQQYAAHKLASLITAGTHVQCLFLEPGGDAIKAREQEEGYPAGHLSALTDINIQTLITRVRDRLDADVRDRLEIATYDETIRFNVVLTTSGDDHLCIFQPYLPQSRGVDSPTFVASRRWPAAGLYPVFDQIFAVMWERGAKL
jgi:hypothetical protein